MAGIVWRDLPADDPIFSVGLISVFVSGPPPEVRFLVGSGSLEDLAQLQDLREREAAHDDPDHEPKSEVD
jgi:hypothetical protein